MKQHKDFSDSIQEGELTIIKASGEQVPFLPDKLRQSLVKSGAGIEQSNAIVAKITGELYPGISTKTIYRRAFNLLKGTSGHFAARYNLKSAIMQLGPSGYAFEKYISEILKLLGYTTQTGQITSGRCVNHEIDIIAEKDNTHCIIECKYHNQRGLKCDVKIPLYIRSRYLDVIEALKASSHKKNSKNYEGWLVTNTQFTEDAIKYGTCIGLKLLGWNYPLNNGLKDIIDNLRAYPVTCLTSLTLHEKEILLKNKIVLCTELCQSKNILEGMGFTPPRIRKIISEGQMLCGQKI